MANTERETIESILKEQILLTANDFKTSVDYNFILTQHIDKYEEELQGNEVFIVLSYGAGTLNYGSTLIPVSVNIVCNQNYVSEIFNLFNTFVEKYNLKKGVKGSNYYIESFTTPTMTGAFQDFEANYSVVCVFNASFLLSTTLTPITSIKIDNENVEFINTRFAYNSQRDAQVFPSTTNAYTRSIMQYGSISFSFNSYFNKGKNLVSKCINISDENSTTSQNANFNIIIGFSDNTNLTLTMKLSGFVLGQSQEGLPTFEATFEL